EPVLEQMLAYGEPVRANDLGASHLLAMAASLLVATAGIGAGLAYYAPATLPYFPRRRLDARLAATRFSGLHNFLVHKWYFDELYDAALVRPTLALARFSAQIDRWVIDGIVNGSAYLTEQVSRIEGLFDLLAVDRLVNLVARFVYAAGDWGRGIQT